MNVCEECEARVLKSSKHFLCLGPTHIDSKSAWLLWMLGPERRGSEAKTHNASLLLHHEQAMPAFPFPERTYTMQET